MYVYIYMCMDIIPTCLFGTVYGSSACEGYKRASDALEVKLQLVFNCDTRECSSFGRAFSALHC